MNAPQTAPCPSCSTPMTFPTWRCSKCGDRVIRPQPGPQSMFLSSEAVIALFGGARGGGKTWSLLVDWMRYIHIPRANGLILRATKEDGKKLWPKMEETFEGTGAYSRAGYWDFTWPCRGPGCAACERKQWPKCPRAARLTMRHLGKTRKDYERHKGPEYNWIGIEEVNECSMAGVEFLFTCLRTSNRALRPVLRMTCNPDDEHPIAEWVRWYLNEDGYPDRTKTGRITYTMRSTKTDERVFEPTRELAAAAAESEPSRAVSFAFVDATSHDNAAIDSEEYGRTFAQMTAEEREKYEDGCWFPSKGLGGMLGSAYWGPTITEPLAPVKMQIRGWDFGASEPAKGRKAPDYTFAPLVKWDIHGRWYVTEPAAWRREPDDTERMFIERVIADGPHVIQALEVEPGAGGKTFVHTMARLVREAFCECSYKGKQWVTSGGQTAGCRCGPRVVLVSPKQAARENARKVKNTDSKITKLRPVARELRLGMRGNRPADRDWAEGDDWTREPRGFLLIDPEDDWTRRPYRDKGDAPPTLGALWRSTVHRFPHAEKDDPPDALGIAHAAKRKIETPAPRGRRTLTVVNPGRR